MKPIDLREPENLCHKCSGSGYTIEWPDTFPIMIPCTTCNGTGFTYNKKTRSYTKTLIVIGVTIVLVYILSEIYQCNGG